MAITFSGIDSKIMQMCGAIISQMGYDLQRVTYEPEDDSMALTLYISKDGGITLDDCERVSLAVDPIIEASGVMDSEQNWTLNVSSPGV